MRLVRAVLLQVIGVGAVLVACKNTAPAPKPSPANATPAQAAPATQNESANDQPELAAAMDRAVKAYDQMDLTTARREAESALDMDPKNVRMSRLMVSIACIEGNAAEARSYYVELPRADQEQMKKRCDRYGVVLAP